jgi:hypothetical protein
MTTPNSHHFDRRADALAQAAPRDDDDLIDTRELAAWFRCSEQWVETGRSRGWGPPCTRLGRLVRYRVGDVKAYLRQRTVAMERARRAKFA